MYIMLNKRFGNLPVLGYVIYNYAIEKGWISLSSFQQEDWTSFHFVDWANSNMRCDSFKSHMIINKLSKFL